MALSAPKHTSRPAKSKPTQASAWNEAENVAPTLGVFKHRFIVAWSPDLAGGGADQVVASPTCWYRP
jgi:hypothetical protein